MMRYAAALTGDSDRAEDLVANVFLKILCGRTPLSRITQQYLRTAVLNEWRRELKWLRRFIPVGDATLTEVRSRAGGDGYERVEAVLELETFIRLLPAKCAAVVRARMTGLTNVEIAELLHVSEKTVSAQLARARVIILNHLEKDDEQDRAGTRRCCGKCRAAATP